MAASNKGTLAQMLEFSWILYNTGGLAGACKVTVTQPKEAAKNISTATISCTFNASGCPTSLPQVQWFRYLASTHEELCTPVCKDGGKFKATGPGLGNHALLQINTPTVNDSAIYVCGIAFSNSNASTSKQTGGGTTLVVQGKQKPLPEESVLMIVLSTLLFLYNAAILAVFIFFFKAKFKLLRKRGDLKGKHDKNSGRRICQAIAQEFYKKRYAVNSPPPENVERNDSIYQNR
uniref:Immunoglobulin superfamily member 6 n=1 Tax=Sphenodon punctatus TaxID=8508 RepID=A0A8D0GDJ0_SPHPU